VRKSSIARGLTLVGGGMVNAPAAPVLIPPLAFPESVKVEKAKAQMDAAYRRILGK
jgi:hypothetical protein